MTEPLDSYYNKITEGDRLFRTKANQIEFYTNCFFIEKYLSKNNSILETGSGHGAYAFYFASKSHDVMATDVVLENVEAIQQNTPPELAPRLTSARMDATDLTEIHDNKFDLTLCLGPLYHLRTTSNRVLCISEAKRVTKPNGYIAFAYINRVSALAYTQSFGVKFDSVDFENASKNDWDYTNFPDDFMNIGFYATPEQISSEIQGQGLDIVEHIASDGLYAFFKEKTEALNEQEYKALLEYHSQTAAIPSSLGASVHNLIIAQARK